MHPFFIRLRLITACLLMLGIADRCAPAATPGGVGVLTEGFTSYLVLPSQEEDLLELWGFAQKAWYLELRQGIPGALSTAVPQEGVVIRARLHSLPETMEGDSTWGWVLEADSMGLARLREWLRRRVDITRRYRPTGEDNRYEAVALPPSRRERWLGWRYHPTPLEYTVWYNCHDYLLEALYEADLLDRPRPPGVLRASTLGDVLGGRTEGRLDAAEIERRLTRAPE